ncbi:MAG: cell envelope biogenesis protein LolA [Pelagibacteraceae bacterium]|jgi:outer membrane lipoprotein-sorting protein|nr:cell envelope biogenesis protein LolA [Pelagibacteraceae bacterium]|tara:strand:- start:407 stop:967 length:561 start_codon:yes stop_codon:yes gene_type:complete
MLKKIILIFFFLFILIKPLYASIEDKIIKNLIKTDNLTFNFKQTINEKTEEGKCIIEYPKKIFCLYNNYNKKIMVSNGRSLAIKNQVSNQYYLYPLKKTPLELILDKNFLINQIKESQGRTVNNKYINFTIIKNNNKINIFFDKKTLDLIGWQTEDIYQNLVITYIYKIQYNQKINKNLFKLPEMN